MIVKSTRGNMIITPWLVILILIMLTMISIIVTCSIGYYRDQAKIKEDSYDRLYLSWSKVIEEIKTVEAREKQALDDLKYINNMNLSLETTVENQQTEITRLESKLNNEIKLEKYLDSKLESLLTKVIELENHAQSSAAHIQKYKDEILALRAKIQIAMKGIK